MSWSQPFDVNTIITYTNVVGCASVMLELVGIHHINMASNLVASSPHYTKQATTSVALQQQHHRSRTSIEDGHKATRVDVRSAMSKIGQMESALQALKIDSGELRRRVNDMSSDNHLQFENVSRVFKTISDAMDLSLTV